MATAVAPTATTATPTSAEGALVARRSRLAYAGLCAASAGWASAFVVGKVVLDEMTPLTVAAWRYVAATALLLPFAVRARFSADAAFTPQSGEPRGEARAVGAALPLAVMVVTGGVLYPWLFLAALSRTSATNTALLVALNPVLTLLLSPLVGERLERRSAGGAAIAFAGAVLVVSRGDPATIAALDLNAGDVLALIAAAAWATFNLASRPVLDRVAPSVTNCTVYAGGGVALLLLARGESPLAQLAQASALAVVGLGSMAVLSSVIAGQLFLIGVRAAGVGRAVLFVYLVPVLTAALATGLLGEQLAAAQAAGGALVLAGLWLATREGSTPVGDIGEAN